ncbi:MAG: iron chaperone [Candidatus Bilamarchaeum sp.]|jgi:uncharacterized protein YdhG (YjbR/CyaY superfamily)
MPKFITIEEYFSSLPEEAKIKMELLRKTIQKAAPDAVEVLSYQMPAFRLGRILVYYAAWKEHLGFYSASRQVQQVFKKELVGYEMSKGTIKFPLSKPLPIDLITKIVKFRVKENQDKSK